MMKILKQRLGKIMQKKGETKIFLEDNVLEKINLSPGKKFVTDIDEEGNKIVFTESEEGKNTVSSRKSNGKPIIDKSGKGIREALEGCDNIKVTFYIEEGIGKVLIQGEKVTTKYTATKEEEERPITSISFCAGAGISSWAEKKAGFKNIAFCEYNPKVGAEDKFANIYQKNNPDSVMFNIPMQLLDAKKDLPYADVWHCTLDCTDFSKLSSGKTEFHTMHLFMHVMRLFWEKPKEERPKMIFIENVEGFAKVAAPSIQLCLAEAGYTTSMTQINSLDFGSRTQRKRFYMVASAYGEEFKFPEPTGRVTTPISDDAVMTVDNINWITPEDNATLKHYVERQKGKMNHNHKITTFDVTKDSYIGTIPKSHCNYIPENMLRHPTKEGYYAFIRNIDHLKYLHGIGEEVYLGDSITTQIQSIGQGVCCKVVYAIAKEMYNYLKRNMFKALKRLSEEVKIGNEDNSYNTKLEENGQLAFAF